MIPINTSNLGIPESQSDPAFIFLLSQSSPHVRQKAMWPAISRFPNHFLTLLAPLSGFRVLLYQGPIRSPYRDNLNSKERIKKRKTQSALLEIIPLSAMLLAS